MCQGGQVTDALTEHHRRVASGGVESLDHIQTVLAEGFEFVQVGRATIQDPDFVRRLQSGEISGSACDHCNRCVAAMDAGGVYCVSNKSGFMHTA